MRNLKVISLIFILSLVCNACFEIREKVTINKDGMGSYQMIMDFSASKKMFQMMLDLANTKEGDAVGLDENPLIGLDSAFITLSEELNLIKGISNAIGITDEANFLFGVELDFEDVEALNKALSKLDRGNENTDPEAYYIFDKKRRFEKTNQFNLQNLTNEMVPREDADSSEEMRAQLQELYDDVTYTVIIETEDRKIRDFSNEEAILSEDKKTLTFSKTLKELKEYDVDLGNLIRLR